jgi:antitoxin MazE
MRARVQKWGNSLGIRIPRALAQEVDVAADSEVEIAARNGKILISPLRKKALTLRQLLLGVTNANLHREVDIGSPVGKESW